MSDRDDSDLDDLKQTPDPDRAERDGNTGWQYALNAFLERAFLKADVDTGC